MVFDRITFSFFELPMPLFPYNFNTAEITPDHPLHYSKFFQQKIHKKRVKSCQNMILFLARLHANNVDFVGPRGFNNFEISTTRLRSHCYDYRQVFDYFFHVVERGYNCHDEEHLSLTIATPKPVFNPFSIKNTEPLHAPAFEPNEYPTEAFRKTRVVIHPAAEQSLAAIPASKVAPYFDQIQWLLKQQVIEFHWAASGRLQARETSVWPIRSIETWPKSIRAAVFGPGVDIAAAYMQFIVSEANAYSNTDDNWRWPDLGMMVKDRTTWRERCLHDIYGVDASTDNVARLKSIIMCLSNGGRVIDLSNEAAMQYSGVSYGVRELLAANFDAAEIDKRAEKIQHHLKHLSLQFKAARQIVANGKIEEHGVFFENMMQQPAKARKRWADREVFRGYFEWEKNARHKILDLCDNTGIMVHDGIDGVPANIIDGLDRLSKDAGILVTAS